MDEAHNLRSAVELDDTITKSFHFIKGDGLFEFITSGTNKARYVTKELNIETGSDILKKMRATENKREARYLLRTLSQWRVFCVVFDKICTLKFLFADPKKRNLLPKGRLFLFSATRLDKEELTFYCDIPQRVLRISGKKMTKFIAKENVEYRCLSLHSDVDKITCATTLLKKNLSTLILLNNNSNCLSWNDALSKTCGDRVVVVQSGLKYSDRVKRFEKFSRSRDKILLTASNVYWEGITIKGLRLLIIPNMPFPQPTLLELAGGRTPQYKKIAERRLIQGMGRIGRMSDEKGICLLLFNPTKSFRYLKVTSIDEIQALIRNLKI
jgi:superfamily II DNA/RNA helicase